MKVFLLTILLASSVSGVSYDMDDLSSFAGYWLDSPVSDPNWDLSGDGSIDLVDFAMFVDSWDWSAPYEPPPDPNANDVSANATTYTLDPMILDGDYCDQYTVTSLPGYGILYDFYNGFRRKFTAVRSVPYRVKRGSSTLYYYCTVTTADSFQYRVEDSSSQSSAATVTVTKAAYTKDSLCFDGVGSVTIIDDPNIEFDESFSLTAWIRPERPFGMIVEKKTAAGGLRLSLRSAHLVAEVWSGSNYGHAVVYETVPLAEWSFIAITCGHADSYQDALYVGSDSVSMTGLPGPPYSNTGSVVIGDRFIGQIDKITWWPALTDFDMATLQAEARTADNGPLAPTNYLAKFKCNEGSGSTIQDVGLFLTGTLNNGAAWYPYNQPRNLKYN